VHVPQTLTKMASALFTGCACMQVRVRESVRMPVFDNHACIRSSMPVLLCPRVCARVSELRAYPHLLL
jgi:hypothetical protein